MSKKIGARANKPKSKSKNTPHTPIVNRRAHFDYALDDELTVGLSLTGPEVRAIRDHHAQLKGSFVTLRHSELWLNNLTLSSTTARPIKLLATRRELAALTRARAAGAQIVPIKLLPGSRYIKLVIATGHGKKKYDKRETIKQRDYARGKI